MIYYFQTSAVVRFDKAYHKQDARKASAFLFSENELDRLILYVVSELRQLTHACLSLCIALCMLHRAYNVHCIVHCAVIKNIYI